MWAELLTTANAEYPWQSATAYAKKPWITAFCVLIRVGMATKDRMSGVPAVQPVQILLTKFVCFRSTSTVTFVDMLFIILFFLSHFHIHYHIISQLTLVPLQDRLPQSQVLPQL